MAHHHEAMPSISSRPSASVRRTPCAEATGSGGWAAGSAPYGCQTRSRSSARRRSQSGSGALLLVAGEVALARAAHRAEPGVGDVLEVRAGGDAAVRIAFVGVVDVAAGLADPALERLGGGHRPPGRLVVEVMRERLARGRVR